MKRNNLRAVSFYQVQQASNYEKYRKLAEIQAKLSLKDITNNQLLNQIESLKQQNQLLRIKIAQKQISSTTINTNPHTKAALNKVNSLLTDSNTSTMRALKSKCQDLQANSYQDLSNQVIKYFQRTKTNTTAHHMASHEVPAKLTKDVYIDRSPPNQHFNHQNSKYQGQLQQKNQGKQAYKITVNQSFTEGMSKDRKREHNESKFPAVLNQFEGKKAQSRFQECSEMAQNPHSSMNKWTSQNNFGLKSQFLTRLKSGQLKKRKTFISVVSVSSKQNKKQKQN